ncbi:SIR2 family protein [Bacillus cereus]|uniref:Uncharacterized protein n=1 Tax=Bacillus anthracis TaxID=1392 RepID=A0A0J1HZ22_BACAN|nr:MULTISPECIES: SIR2 family protein [Bacillus cereus group]EDX67068.1 conserved hypothetical protein [Bacillus cereus NVH0597-99]KLV18969.1 hypothetical protein ABW01_10290 [Bacillus anthracis]MBJ8082399.1 SIR2 family protein [Bacillus cereus group sp. N14]MDA2472072.1 SIR2 family protein [Bacillus cereus]MDE7542752.1 SIR2 family protein [Bacillus cereus]
MSERVIKELKKYIESGNVSFLVGAGASIGAISTLGDFENEITTLIWDYQSDNTDVGKKLEIANMLNKFLDCSVEPNSNLINGNISGMERIEGTLEQYKKFVRVIYKLLLLRASDKLPKKINIFTTNYDLFFEYACEELRVAYNDGGLGIINRCFSSKNFQKRIYQLSDSYSYEYESPVINLIKLHGSINWLLDDNNSDILIKNQICIARITQENIDDKGFITENTNVPIILPTKQKFIRTLMEHTYYDLARFYSNELEREHSVLFCFGFSFADEHIRSITQRALGNPSLTLLIFPYSTSDERGMINHFKDFPNVKVIRIDKGEDDTVINIHYAVEGMEMENRKNIDFNTFTDLFYKILTQVEGI